MRFLKSSLVGQSILALSLSCGALMAQAQAVDVAAAEDVIKFTKCGQCHAVSAKKDGPAFTVTAAKYKGKKDAEAKLYKHLTVISMVKVDGVEEEHRIVDSKKYKEADIKNLVRYILSR